MIGLCGVTARGQENSPPAAPPGVDLTKPLTPPSPADSMKAYRLVYDWVRAAAAPEVNPNEQPQIPGACVVLRSGTGIVGRGTSFADDNSALRTAAAAAIAEARTRLALPNDALADERARAAAKEWSISLELAGPLIPITPATFADCDLELQNGLDGLAARVGGPAGKLAANFPGLMLSLGLSPSDALVAAISTASGKANVAIKIDPKGQPPNIAADQRATFYRFRATHLAQQNPRAEPVFLFRGGRVVSERELTREVLGEFAFNLADRLAGHPRTDGLQPQPLADPYFSWRGRAATSTEPVLDQTLRLLGLLSFSALPPVPPEVARAAELRASAIGGAATFLREQRLAAEEQRGAALTGSTPPSAIYAAGFASLAAAAARCPAGDAGSAWQVLSEWPQWDAILAVVYSADKGWAEKIGEAQRAFIAHGLACRAAQPGLDPASRAARRTLAEAALRSIYRETKPGMLVSHMPWLGWAELLLAEGQKSVPAAAALRDMRDLVWKHQLSADDVGDDAPDLAGGIVFTSGPNPLPTWQSVRPVAFLATMTGDPRLSDGPERLREVSRTTAAIRFLRQLAIDEYAAYAAPDPQTALWGVRASVWDQRQTPEATALTLIAVCETLRALDTIAGTPPEKVP